MCVFLLLLLLLPSSSAAVLLSLRPFTTGSYRREDDGMMASLPFLSLPSRCSDVIFPSQPPRVQQHRTRTTTHSIYMICFCFCWFWERFAIFLMLRAFTYPRRSGLHFTCTAYNLRFAMFVSCFVSLSLALFLALCAGCFFYFFNFLCCLLIMACLKRWQRNKNKQNTHK